VQQRHDRRPARTQDRDERRRRDQHRALARRPRRAGGVARRRPAQQVRAADEPRRPVAQDERAVGQLAELGVLVALGARGGGEALAVELRVDRVRARLSGMPLGPERAEAVVVGAATERARPVAGGEGGRLVEEEQLREASRLEQRRPAPAAELQAARDPTAPGVAAANAPVGVVQAAAIAVDQPEGGVRDELRERGDAVGTGQLRPEA
jgi:hypothetical protein